MRMLHLFFSVFGEFQAPSIGLEYELKCVQSLTIDPFGRKYSWNNAKEEGGKKIVLVCLDVPSESLFIKLLRSAHIGCPNTQVPLLPWKQLRYLQHSFNPLISSYILPLNCHFADITID